MALGPIQHVESGSHAVQFYAHDAELADTVGGYLLDGLWAGEVAVVIAGEAHRQAFACELAAAGIDPEQARRDGTLMMLDATETMSGFVADGRIDRDGFYRVIGSTIRAAVETGRPVRAYGEMVAVLWDAGDVLAAIELETLWNELGREFRFSLLCGYRTTSVSGPEHADALHQVCHLHSSVLGAPPLADRTSEVSEEFGPDADAPGAARRMVREALRGSGHDDDLLQDAQLVVSELATNAVLHARSGFSVLVRTDCSAVHVRVQDGSSTRPVLRDAGPTATFGRGMRLVADLSSDWGVDLTAHGKTVWAQLRA